MKRICAFLLLLLVACGVANQPTSPAGTSVVSSVTPSPFHPVTATMSATAPFPDTLTPRPSETPTVTATHSPVPDFATIVIFVFENKEFGTVVGNPQMPNFNHYAQTYTLLTAEYAVTHPSLPNYLALIGGDTFGITSDCTKCFVDAPSLPDLIEQSGRTWKAYQEDMPKPCYVGDTLKYAQKHDPFIYFTPIRENQARCERSIVPLTQLDADIAANALPNFIFITPNICNDAHDCDVKTADAWIGEWVAKVQNALAATQKPYLIFLTWDEGQGNHSCCGLPAEAGGRVATVLISPQAKSGFQDDTPYTHYSILKTIAASWGLSFLGHTADPEDVLITAPWQ